MKNINFILKDAVDISAVDAVLSKDGIQKASPIFTGNLNILNSESCSNCSNGLPVTHKEGSEADIMG